MKPKTISECLDATSRIIKAVQRESSSFAEAQVILYFAAEFYKNKVAIAQFKRLEKE